VVVCDECPPQTRFLPGVPLFDDRAAGAAPTCSRVPRESLNFNFASPGDTYA